MTEVVNLSPISDEELEHSAETPTVEWVQYPDGKQYGLHLSLEGMGEADATLSYGDDEKTPPSIYVDMFRRDESSEVQGVGSSLLKAIVQEAKKFGTTTLGGHFTSPEALGALAKAFGPENIHFSSRYSGEPVEISFEEAMKAPDAYKATVSLT